MSAEFKKFNSIEQFRNILQRQRKYYPDLKEAVFKGTVKIHGTNAAVGVNVDTKEVFFQSRNRIITPEDDNLGFATWAKEREQFWLAIARQFCETGVVHFYGEWCGPGIQKGVAVSELSERKFIIFEVSGISRLLNVEWPDGVHSIEEFQTFDVFVDFAKPHEAQKIFHELTTSVEACCPVGKAFGIEGVGEGLVWTYWHEGRKIQFKTKGEKHSATKVKTIADVDVERFTKLQEFANAVVSETRCEQGVGFLREMGEELTLQNIGKFLKWVSDDIVKEECDTFEANGFSEKEVRKAATSLAASWYKGRYS